MGPSFSCRPESSAINQIFCVIKSATGGVLAGAMLDEGLAPFASPGSQCLSPGHPPRPKR